MEAAAARLDEVSDEPGELEKFPTPGVKTIDDLANFEGGAPADRQVKSLTYFLEGEFVLVLLTTILEAKHLFADQLPSTRLLP